MNTPGFKIRSTIIQSWPMIRRKTFFIACLSAILAFAPMLLGIVRGLDTASAAQENRSAVKPSELVSYPSYWETHWIHETVQLFHPSNGFTPGMTFSLDNRTGITISNPTFVSTSEYTIQVSVGAQAPNGVRWLSVDGRPDIAPNKIAVTRLKLVCNDPSTDPITDNCSQYYIGGYSLRTGGDNEPPWVEDQPQITATGPMGKIEPQTVYVYCPIFDSTVDEAQWTLSRVSKEDGICGNAGDTTQGPGAPNDGNDDDYSFQKYVNNVGPIDATTAPNPPDLHWVAPQIVTINGQRYAKVTLYCKDYGGTYDVKVTLKASGAPIASYTR